MFLLLFGMCSVLFAKSDEITEPTALFKNLELSLQTKDRSFFEKEVVITLDEYLQYYSEKKPLLEKEKQQYQDQYDRQKNKIIQSWEMLFQFLDKENLSFKEAEYLAYSTFRQKKQANYTLGYRINRDDYDIKLANCLYVNGQWKLASDMQMKKREPYKPVFKKANTTWGSTINPSGEIPTNKFKRTYFNIETKKIIQTDVVQKPYMDITKDNDFAKRYNITNKEFAVYLVGNIDFEKTVQKNIAVRSSDSADLRVIVDGNIVCENKCYDTPYTFEKGRHTIEIEYLNGINFFHWAKIYVTFVDIYEYYSKKETQHKLQNLITPSTKLWYLSIYEPTNPTEDVHLELKDSQDPTVLFISSYRAINFVIENLKKANLKAIISSGESGTTFNFKDEKAVPVIRTLLYDNHRINFETELLPKCETHPISRCDGGFVPVFEKIKSFAQGKELDGISFGVKNNTISIPQIELTKVKRQEIIDESKKILDKHTMDVPPKSYDALFAQTDTNVKVPKDGYKVTYYDKKSQKMILSQKTDYPSIKGGRDIAKIEAQEFMAKWERNVNVDKDEERYFEIENGWSEVKIIVDGQVIYNQTEKPANDIKQIKHHFKKGMHHVEIRFINGWHTVDLYVALKSDLKKLTLDETKKELSSLMTDKTKIYYSAIESTKDENNRVTIFVKEDKMPIILFLNINESMHVEIDNMAKQKIKAIVYYAKKAGTVTVKNPTSDIKMIALNDKLSYVPGLPMCEENQKSKEESCRYVYVIDFLNKDIQKFTGKNVDGVNVEKLASHISIPSLVMNEQQYRNIKVMQDKDKEINKIRKEKSDAHIKKLKNGQFESAFEEPKAVQ